MGGVLQYKWEVYCWFSLFQGFEAREAQRYQWEVYCRTNWRCIAALSPRPVVVGVAETLLTILTAESIHGLQSWRPSKEVPKPRPGKVPKKCFGRCRSETGCFGKCRKKCSGSRLLYYLYIGAEPGALFSAPSSAPRFGPALSEALFRHFSWPGLRHFFRWPPGL